MWTGFKGFKLRKKCHIVVSKNSTISVLIFSEISDFGSLKKEIEWPKNRHQQPFDKIRKFPSWDRASRDQDEHRFFREVLITGKIDKKLIDILIITITSIFS